jgi:hypothetical protein
MEKMRILDIVVESAREARIKNSILHSYRVLLYSLFILKFDFHVFSFSLHSYSPDNNESLSDLPNWILYYTTISDF